MGFYGAEGQKQDVEEMSKLMKDSLSKIEVSLPDGIGEGEIANAIG